jgi:hypothetical protein
MELIGRWLANRLQGDCKAGKSRLEHGRDDAGKTGRYTIASDISINFIAHLRDFN